MKTCTQCKRELPKENFRKYSGRSKDGLRPLCVACQREYEQDWRQKNKERLAATRARRAEQEKKYRLEYDATNRGRLLVMQAKRRCKKCNIQFDLDKHMANIEERLQRKTCEMTGLPLDFYNHGVKWNSPSIDRIIPANGYVYSNIRIVCFAMNAALGSWGEEILRKVMTAWLEGK